MGGANQAALAAVLIAGMVLAAAGFRQRSGDSARRGTARRDGSMRARARPPVLGDFVSDTIGDVSDPLLECRSEDEFSDIESSSRGGYGATAARAPLAYLPVA